ncbi:phosphomannomutase/phosphoglucomutase [Chitinibacter bivalviorum]|uniref:Phosphomannomutase/phosphoglucomutase n=1 Tax=Chitinibacter bivalviorum TaxID=2739434 RepID=A0A7H9BLQ2_9NEIS|nr:phosphomannomutase/phosphoglucomutase [Chitinibacter bivalviorum]QLG89218.1 phosphomannomutase/phosphoglucomutase [Chitinibacter bivalviorum]
MSRVPAAIFKAYDIRGPVSLLTSDVAYWVGRAIGAQAKSRHIQSIALAGDGRLSTPDLLQATERGLIEAGIQVQNLGMACTPLLYFAAKYHADASGVMITGSHNPPEYNGIKIVLGGETIDGAALQALREQIEAEQLPVAQGAEVNHHDVYADYLAHMQQTIALKKKLNIVIDCGNGAPGAVAPSLFRDLGCNVTELYCEVDGHFPNHHPDPQVVENLRELRAKVLEIKADVGIAFDGDGDRLGVVTAQGQIIPGDRLLMIFASIILQQQTGHVLYDVKSSRAVAQWVKQLGGTSEAIPTGHSHMKRKLKQSKALLAGELSGHFAFAGWDVDDALFAAAKLLQAIADGLDLDSELARLPQCLATHELQIPLSGAGHLLVKDIAAKAQFPTASSISFVDGLRIEYADGFGLIRASNTTPVLTLRIEADEAQALHRIEQELAAAIAPLPFPQYSLSK